MVQITLPYFLIAAVILFIILFVSQGKTQECFVSGENIRMEPDYNYFFSKCLQSYPIAFRGPTNSGYYTCVRKTDELLRNMGQGCDICYNNDQRSRP